MGTSMGTGMGIDLCTTPPHCSMEGGGLLHHDAGSAAAAAACMDGTAASLDMGLSLHDCDISEIDANALATDAARVAQAWLSPRGAGADADSGDAALRSSLTSLSLCDRDDASAGASTSASTATSAGASTSASASTAAHTAVKLEPAPWRAALSAPLCDTPVNMDGIGGDGLSLSLDLSAEGLSGLLEMAPLSARAVCSPSSLMRCSGDGALAC